MIRLNPDEAAKSQISWWKDYHNRNWERMKGNIVDLIREEHGVEISEELADYFVEASKDYIKYKECLSKGMDKEAKDCLMLAERNMTFYYRGIKSELENLEK